VLPADETGVDWMTDGDWPLLRRHWGVQAKCAHPTRTLVHHQNAAVPSRSTKHNDINHSLPSLTSIYHPPTHPHPHPFLPLFSSIYRTPLIPSTLFHPFHLPTSLPSSTIFTHSISFLHPPPPSAFPFTITHPPLPPSTQHQTTSLLHPHSCYNHKPRGTRLQLSVGE